MLLETMVNSLNGVLYASIAYPLMNYAAFTLPDNLRANFLHYMAAVVAQTNAASMILMLCALVSPNQDIAFTIGAGESQEPD